MIFRNRIPQHIFGLFQCFGVGLALLSITRVLFFIFNISAFSHWKFTDFFAGIWFDSITLGIYFIPLYGLTLLPLPWRGYSLYRFLHATLFCVTISVLLFLNLMDIEYFAFTSKRSTADLFAVVAAGNDVNQLLFTFLSDFWLIILLFVGLLFISIRFYLKKIRRGESTFKTANSKFYISNSVYFLLLTPLLLIIGRGGLGYRPVGVLTATRFTAVENTAIVLNTPFTIIKSMRKEGLKNPNYFTSRAELYNHFSTRRNLIGSTQLPEGTNVMVLILESFGNEWLGKKKNKVGYTPFLDSLIEHSLYFPNAFANGKKSIEAVPAIFAGIPSLMDNPYITSQYGTNRIETLITQLKKRGYSSAFFHGATNGSMKFNEFSELAGFEKYIGRDEYNNEAHADATWGILDEYFNPWTAKQMSKMQEPFVTGLFTLSSHHPYFVPEKWRKLLPKEKESMAQSIAYGDLSLKLFFEEAKKQDWFKRTLFVILADHTPAGTSIFYQHRLGMYGIPIAFYHPQGLIKPRIDKQLMDQIDIYPTLMDWLTDEESVYSFGQSIEDKKENTAIYYLEGTYYYLKNDYAITFAQNKARNLYNYKKDTMLYLDSVTFYPKLKEEMETELKAIIQVYNEDLISNQTRLK
ncbi:MAG: LTA synthase family protein [Lishizhenia sp.]